MESFFARVNARWPAGRQDYHWHILAPSAPTELVETYRGLTHRPGIAPVDPEWIHLTLLHSAPVTAITDDELETIIARVRQRCATVAPLTVELDRPAVGSVAIECLARPGERLRELWQITAKASQDATGDRFNTVPEVHYAHVSLGYAVDHVDQRPLRQWLCDRPISTLTPYTFPVTSIHLVAQQHDGQRITWRPITQIPLAATA